MTNVLAETRERERGTDVRGFDARRITDDDVLFARRYGYTLRLLAEVEIDEGDESAQRLVRIGPALFPKNHPLASVRYEDKSCDPAISAMLREALRADARATIGSAADGRAAVDSDPSNHIARPCAALLVVAPVHVRPCRHFVRVPLGATHSPRDIFESLRQNGVAVKQVDVCDSIARMLTHPATTQQVRNAASELDAPQSEVLIAPAIVDRNELGSEVCSIHVEPRP